MGRKPRHDFNDSWHHVMNRGAARQRVFFTVGDGEYFEHLLAEASDLTDVEVHAYCLMSNHFHLLLHCPSSRLSEFMQRVGAMYARRLNLRSGRDGPIFKSRFHSLVVDTHEYLDRVGRYIHRNPIDVDPSLPVDRYRWSSFSSYVGTASAQPWLHTDALLAMRDGDRAAYRSFVTDPLTNNPPRLEGLEATIEMVLDEFDPEQVGSRRGLARSLALALVDGCDVDLAHQLIQSFDLPSDGAERVALHRARQRLRTTPLLASVVARARDLAA